MPGADEQSHDARIKRMLNRDPILVFSFYTHIQIVTLRETATRLRAELDDSIGDGTADGEGLNRAYGLFWLWTLGAYEVVRTMDQAQRCFSATAAQRIGHYKRRIAKVRVPFAKLELAGKRQPVSAELSITGFDFASRDLRFDIDGSAVSPRRLIEDFENLIESITRQDVLADHRTGYPPPAP